MLPAFILPLLGQFYIMFLLLTFPHPCQQFQLPKRCVVRGTYCIDAVEKHTSLPTSQSVVFIPRPLPLIFCVPLQPVAFTLNVSPWRRVRLLMFIFSYTLLLPYYITLFVNFEFNYVYFQPFAFYIYVFYQPLSSAICVFFSASSGFWKTVDHLAPFTCCWLSLTQWFEFFFFFLAPTFIRGCFLRLRGEIFLRYCAHNGTKAMSVFTCS